MLTKLIFYVSLIALIPRNADAQPRVLTIDDDYSTFPGITHMETFIDPTTRLTFKEIQQIYADGGFSSAQASTLSNIGVPATIWFRLAVRNQINEPLFLSFPQVLLEEIVLYQSLSSGEWQSTSSGHLHPFHSRALPFNRYTFQVSVPAGQTVILFGAVTAKSGPPLRIDTSVGSWNAIASESRNAEYLSMTVLGYSIILLLYSIGISIATKDALFFYFSAYIASVVLLIMWFTGFSFEWFWPNSPDLNKYRWQPALFYFAQLWFVNRLLEIHRHLPRLHKLSYIIYLFACMMTVSIAMSATFQWVMTVVISIVSSIYFVVCSISLMNKRVKAAYLFTIGWVPLLGVSLLPLLAIAGILLYPAEYERHAWELAFGWELMFFSLVLAYRYNSVRDEKQRVENDNIRILNEQKTLLRTMILKQTEEIMSQNDQLVQNQEEIQAQNEKLEAQNKAYERLKELILKQNHELEAAVQRRTLQLAQSHDDLKRHLQQVEQFSFIAAHNLRAPVARILGLASIFDRSKLPTKENISVLDRIVESAKDLDIIIHDLGAILDTQKNTSEKIESVDIRELLDKILSRFESEVGREGIRIAINAEAKQIMAVPAYIDSILSNLISNSIKYRTDKGPWIHISTEDIPAACRIAVEDNGLGFDSNLFSKKLFEPFQRFHTHKEGKGLGMFLVKTQVVAMQGTIEVHSKPNHGTRVSIVIPKIRLQKSA